LLCPAIRNLLYLATIWRTIIRFGQNLSESAAISMQFIRIVVACIFAAVVYGIGHDQITARVCVEYFTIGHPPVFNTQDPTLLGLGWGIIATWWAGALLGIPLAIVARAGSRPKRSLRSLVRPICILLFVMAVCAAAAGVAGWYLANSGAVVLMDPLAAAVPADKHVAFIADGAAHLASYAVGFLGGIVVIVLVWRSRRSPAASPDCSPSPAPIHADI
jgi:hypothetical protein